VQRYPPDTPQKYFRMVFESSSTAASKGLNYTKSNLAIYIPNGREYLKFRQALQTLLTEPGGELLEISVATTAAGADLEIGMENGRYIFLVKDTRLTHRGFDRLSHSIGHTPEEITSFLHGAHHYYRELDSEERHSILDGVVVEFYRLEFEWPYFFSRSMAPTGTNLLVDGVIECVAENDVPYGIKLVNNTTHDLYPVLLYFNSGDLSIRERHFNLRTNLNRN